MLSIPIAIVVIIVSFFLIGKSADVLIKALANLGKRLGWNEFVIGFIILGLATSTPELFVALNAGWENYPQLSLGNILGGMIVLFTLLIGLNALLQGVIFTEKKFSVINVFRFLPRALPFWRPNFFIKDLFLMATIILLPLFLLWDRVLSRVDGLILIIAYLFFILHAIYDRRMDGWDPPVEVASSRKIIFWFIIGLSGLFIFSWLIVEQAVFLAETWQVPTLILGLLVLSIGTNLPELTLTIKARKYHSEVVVGDILGSAMANILVLGLLSLFFPFEIIVWQPLLIVSLSLIVVTLVLIIFLHTKDRLERWEGGVLVGMYLMYLIIELIKL